MSDFQDLMMEPEGSDDGARRLVPELTYHNGTIYPNHIWACWNCQLRYQTLKTNHGQSVFHENINKSKHG
ncbi:hypothetical protein EVAR_81883_1 [Eumeta japonica]|uniref:Uncharacterized protein n=1 Tax=Eumeta variegata TaxID=151549 RepID=A0A4C1UX11_EUMVA|nr:hypothetical protein EVAR_81883_1 [Eumeta japonica]